MALTKQPVIDKIEILEYGQVQLRQAVRVFDNGVLVGERFHRLPVLEPGQDVSTMGTRIQRICTAVWTPDVVTAYQQQKAAQAALD